MSNFKHQEPNFTPNAADVNGEADFSTARIAAVAANDAGSAANLLALGNAVGAQINAAVDGANPYVHP
eukprot:SAG25_NODE_9647_length_364_cov_0.626415_1_plen_67_part_10